MGAGASSTAGLAGPLRWGTAVLKPLAGSMSHVGAALQRNCTGVAVDELLAALEGPTCSSLPREVNPSQALAVLEACFILLEFFDPMVIAEHADPRSLSCFKPTVLGADAQGLLDGIAAFRRGVRCWERIIELKGLHQALRPALWPHLSAKRRAELDRRFTSPDVHATERLAEIRRMLRAREVPSPRQLRHSPLASALCAAVLVAEAWGRGVQACVGRLQGRPDYVGTSAAEARRAEQSARRIASADAKARDPSLFTQGGADPGPILWTKTGRSVAADCAHRTCEVSHTMRCGRFQRRIGIGEKRFGCNQRAECRLPPAEGSTAVGGVVQRVVVRPGGRHDDGQQPSAAAQAAVEAVLTTHSMAVCGDCAAWLLGGGGPVVEPRRTLKDDEFITSALELEELEKAVRTQADGLRRQWAGAENAARTAYSSALAALTADAQRQDAKVQRIKERQQARMNTRGGRSTSGEPQEQDHDGEEEEDDEAAGAGAGDEEHAPETLPESLPPALAAIGVGLALLLGSLDTAPQEEEEEQQQQQQGGGGSGGGGGDETTETTTTTTTTKGGLSASAAVGGSSTTNTVTGTPAQIAWCNTLLDRQDKYVAAVRKLQRLDLLKMSSSSLSSSSSSLSSFGSDSDERMLRLEAEVNQWVLPEEFTPAFILGGGVELVPAGGAGEEGGGGGGGKKQQQQKGKKASSPKKDKKKKKKDKKKTSPKKGKGSSDDDEAELAATSDGAASPGRPGKYSGTAEQQAPAAAVAAAPLRPLERFAHVCALLRALFAHAAAARMRAEEDPLLRALRSRHERLVTRLEQIEPEEKSQELAWRDQCLRLHGRVALSFTKPAPRQPGEGEEGEAGGGGDEGEGGKGKSKRK